jgi:FMN phosphatase YigB (HAD superfamily)
MSFVFDIFNTLHALDFDVMDKMCHTWSLLDVYEMMTFAD